MVRVIWTPAALDDLNDIKEFISNDSIQYAMDEMGRILTAADSLQEFPHLGKIASKKFTPPIRQIISGNYRIIYRIVEMGSVEILSITHGARQVDLDKLLLEPETHYENTSDSLTPQEEAKVEKALNSIKAGPMMAHNEMKQKAEDWLKDLLKEG